MQYLKVCLWGILRTLPNLVAILMLMLVSTDWAVNASSRPANQVMAVLGLLLGWVVVGDINNLPQPQNTSSYSGRLASIITLCATFSVLTLVGASGSDHPTATIVGFGFLAIGGFLALIWEYLLDKRIH